MTRLPILFFPNPTEAARGVPDGGGGGKLHQPSVGRQSQRLGPVLADLQQAFDERRVELQATPEGVDPEQVLVLETIGRVDEFYKAVARIPELDWLGEHDIEEIEPDEDFFNEEKPEKLLGGRVYLMMSNQNAMQQLVTLWDRYKANPKMKFTGADYGLAKVKDVFLLLKNIRRWGVEDRLLESELMAVWLEDMNFAATQNVDVEVELWFRRDERQRRAAEASVTRHVSSLDGRVLQTAIIPEIGYHSVLAELPRGAVDEMISNADVELVKNDAVMLFRPTGQSAAKRQPNETELTDIPNHVPAASVTKTPVVAVLDGCPLLNHRVLAGRISFDDPDNFAASYPPAARGHGTAMCSLVIAGDLNDTSPRLSSPVYSRPIMLPRQDQNGNWVEEIPRSILLVDLIHRCVHRMFDGDAGGAATAPNVKVINLSIGDPYRPFDYFLSPLARLLDWLSHRYGVLFVVSAGNHCRSFSPGSDLATFRSQPASVRERNVIRRIYEDSRNRRLLSPAESVNSLTVGARHCDLSTPVTASRLVELFSSDLGSPVSALGSGYRKAIKPDVIRPGGRVRYTEDIVNPVFKYSPSFHPPGIRVAAPSPIAGELNRTSHTEGTSNSAALMTHDLGLCYENLIQVISSQNSQLDMTRYGGQMLKALAVHCSDWKPFGPIIAGHIKTPANAKIVKRLVSRWIGYGDGDISRVMQCAPGRATALGFGELEEEKGHIFKLPLPVELGPSTDYRTLRITLAWFSPVAPTTQRYRRAHLWFDVSGNTFANTRHDADGKAVRSGTLQHELFYGNKGSVIDPDATVNIKVSCRREAGAKLPPIRYALAVTLEVAPGVNIPIYERLSQRIRQRAAVPAN